MTVFRVGVVENVMPVPVEVKTNAWPAVGATGIVATVSVLVEPTLLAIFVATDVPGKVMPVEYPESAVLEHIA